MSLSKWPYCECPTWFVDAFVMHANVAEVLAIADGKPLAQREAAKKLWLQVLRQQTFPTPEAPSLTGFQGITLECSHCPRSSLCPTDCNRAWECRQCTRKYVFFDDTLSEVTEPIPAILDEAMG